MPDGTPPVEVTKATLWSYGGTTQVTSVCTPKNNSELAAALRLGQQREYGKITFRSGGRSFDTQALNDVLVISLERFDSIEVDADAATVTVGASASWGAILKKTAEKGLVPHVMVTSSQATASGTLSADCLSRFSPTHGKEGHHVRWFELMHLDGHVERCSRTENRALFCAVISGMGYLGAVIRICYELVRLPYQGDEIAVATNFQPFKGLPHLAASLRPHMEELHQPSAQIEAVRDQAPSLSAVIYMNKAREGLIMRSKYVSASAEQRKGKGTVLHQPGTLAHQALQVAALFTLPRLLGFFYTFNVMFRRPEDRDKIDELQGFTFFQDGNEKVKQWGRAWGLPMGVRQQTFIVPWDAQDHAGSEQRLAGFLNDMDTLLDTRGLLPTLIDVLYVPDDQQDDFLMSSSRKLPGFAISVAFEKILTSQFPEEERALRDISAICHDRYQGRVHLVKHVYAEPKLMEEMYPGLPQLLKHKDELDPTGVLQNEFLRRVFPVAVERRRAGG